MVFTFCGQSASPLLLSPWCSKMPLMTPDCFFQEGRALKICMIRPQFSAVVDATQFFLWFYYHFHHFSSKHLIYIYLTVVEMVVEVVEIWQKWRKNDKKATKSDRKTTEKWRKSDENRHFLPPKWYLQVFFTTDFADDTDFGCALFMLLHRSLWISAAEAAD